jgi:hypothetical protein
MKEVPPIVKQTIIRLQGQDLFSSNFNGKSSQVYTHKQKSNVEQSMR